MKLTRREAMKTAGGALAAPRASAATRSTGPLTLWYRKPALNWEREALPVGNGNLGAMVFGGVAKERIQLNEHSLWSGRREDIDSPQTLEYLPKVRQLLFDGLYLSLQCAEVFLQLGNLFSFGLVAALEPAVATAALAAAAFAVAAFTTSAVVMPMLMMMPVSFIAAHSYPRFLFFDGEDVRVTTTDSYSARN